MLRIDPKHPNLAPGSPAMALEDLDRSRLPRPVGPEECEDLATSHMEVDAPHGLQAVVGHPQARNLDHGIRRTDLQLPVGRDSFGQRSLRALVTRHAHRATLAPSNHLRARLHARGARVQGALAAPTRT